MFNCLHGMLMRTYSTLSHVTVLQYYSKYVTKSEPRSHSLKEISTSIVCILQQCNTSLKAVQNLFINTVGERDYSAQETCHLLLQLPMFKASRDFIILSLVGSCAVEANRKRYSMLQHCPLLTTTLDVQTPPTSTP